MSESTRWACICEQERSVNLDASTLCGLLDSSPVSPIDNFYSYVASLIPLGDEQGLRENEALGKVLLLGMVSAAEHYFRAVLAGLIFACPVVRKKSSSEKLSLGALDYYSRQDLGLALLEHVSLATTGELQRQTQRLVGIDIKQNRSLDAALMEYEKLCQIRHAAVHARGDLSHQNMQALDVGVGSGRMALKVELPGLHAATAACQNVVRAYNRLLFRTTIERWIQEKVFKGEWKVDSEYYSRLFGVFYSRIDSKRPASSYNSYRSLQPSLRKAILRTEGS